MKARGLRVVFYPFILMTDAGKSWRGEIAFKARMFRVPRRPQSTTFLGSAAASQFTRDTTNLTVAYSGSPTDFTYRRMILHYANLCVVAGGVDLFLLGSEFRGIETFAGRHGPRRARRQRRQITWDYPFVAGLMQLANDVRAIFNNAGLTKDISTCTI